MKVPLSTFLHFYILLLQTFFFAAAVPFGYFALVHSFSVSFGTAPSTNPPPLLVLLLLLL